jgi:hypothetical protein
LPFSSHDVLGGGDGLLNTLTFLGFSIIEKKCTREPQLANDIK